MFECLMILFSLSILKTAEKVRQILPIRMINNIYIVLPAQIHVVPFSPRDSKTNIVCRKPVQGPCDTSDLDRSGVF